MFEKESEEEIETEAQAEENKAHEEEKEPEVEIEEEVQKEGEEEVQNESRIEVDLNEGKDVEEEREQAEKVEKEGRIYTEEKKKGWILTVYKTDDVPTVGKTNGTEETAKTPVRFRIKLRKKCTAKKQYAPARKGKSKLRKSDNPKKFTTPLVKTPHALSL